MGVDDLDDLLQDDLQTVRESARSMRNSDGFDPDWAQVGEGGLWALTLTVALGFVVVMPWVGPDGMVTGPQWLGGGLGGMLVTGGAAGAMRLARTQLGEETRTARGTPRSKR